MSSPVILRIVFGGDDDARKLTLKTGIPKSVDDLFFEIMTVFGVKQKFRVQYKDKDFGNEYINLMSTSQIEDGDILKVIFLSTDDCNPYMQETAPDAPSCSSILVPSPSSTCSFDVSHWLSPGSQLIPPPKLRSDIAEGMAEEICRYAAYPLCRE